MKKIIISGVVGAIALAAFLLWPTKVGETASSGSSGAYVTVMSKKDSVRRIVNATGAIRPLVTVDIGSQLSGNVEEVLVDFNDDVKTGQLLARIDPQTFATRVKQAEADLAVAEANIKIQQANVTRAKANLAQAKRDENRQAPLAKNGNLSVAALDQTRTRVETGEADVQAAEAQLTNARALLGQREASLQQARIDLSRAEIRSPIDGVVINRSVDIGQTVAASFSAPLLFQLAQDLSEIQVEASVDEADIGQVRAGNPVSFTVDAFQNQSFKGMVDVVRLAPTELNNVVTYTVIITAKNPRRQLLPGMTANVEIITGERTDILTVPEQAFRFKPKDIDVEKALAAARGAQGGQQGRGRGRPSVRERMARFVKPVGISEEQMAAIEQSFKEVGPRMGALFRSGQERSVIMQQVQAMSRQAITQHLSREQTQKYDQLVAEFANIRTAPIWVLDAETNQPVPKFVRVGLSDGEKAEILRGLDEGAAVITRAARKR